MSPSAVLARHAGLHACPVAFGLAVLVACATEPRGPVLTGQYGGRMLGLVATDTAAHFRFACDSAVTGPLRLQNGGAYRASGAGTDGLNAPAWSLDVTATPSGNDALYLLLVATRVYRDSTYRSGDIYALSRGASPDFSGVGCLAG